MSSDSSDEEVARTSSPSHKFNSCKIMGPKLQKPQSNPISIAKSESVEIRRRISYPEGVDLQQIRPRVSDDRLMLDENASKRVHYPRKRSIYGASPNCNFGPKASIMKNSSSVLTIPDPGIQRLTWSKPPVSVLVIKKIFDDAVFEPFRRLLRWLIQEKEMVVYVEESVLKEPQIQDNEDFNHLVNLLHTFKEVEDNLNDMIDFIICLGGDGTLLYASSLFQQSVPPVMAFHLGSLGFLTPFQFDDFKDQVTHVLEGHATLTLRSRLKCIMCKKDSEFVNCDHINSIESTKGGVKHQITTVLNEVVIGRGQSAYLCNLDLYVEKRLITSVQGDGLIISTPTGSTAYACAAGASVVHPNVPAIVIVPICPHSLSFRPIVIPAGVEIKVMLSESARNTAWVSYDGRNRQELKSGDCVRITTSMYPVPSISFKDQINDWFNALAECLHWNVRKNQQNFTPSYSGQHESTLSLDSLCLDSSDNNGHDA